MPNSLKVKLSKLRYKGQITNDEYKELIIKLDGHDKQIRAVERAKVIEEISKEVAFEEKWLSDAIREDKGNYTYNIDIAFSGIKNSLNKLAKRES